MRTIITIVLLSVAGYGAWWTVTTHPEIKNKIEDFLDTGYFHTLEVRFSAERIMESRHKELLKDNQHKYLEPTIKFYPYLLMEVKYTPSEDKTAEGVILWDLTDGEMVTRTRDWEKTHGFGDCINANAERHEFKILNILSKKGGTIDRDGLSKAMNVENDILDAWIDSCRKKKLIVQTGNRFRLHLQNPNLRTAPQTLLDERLVTMPLRDAIRQPRHYSVSQIERLTKAAFGHDFAIRRVTDVYLPVHCITVQNPDGSIHTSYWNALNGKRLAQIEF